MTRRLEKNLVAGHAAKSGRGLPQSRTLARWRSVLNFAKRLGVRQSSAAVVVAFACLVWNAKAETNNFFSRGIEAARTGDFSDAAIAFQKSVKSQPSSGALVNLGIAEWRRGHAGAAVLAWEQTRWIDPFDARALQNLKFARTAAQLDEPELRWFEIASKWLPPNLWVWLAGASLWLAVGALILPPVFRWKKSGGRQTVAALGFCVFLFAVTANVGVVGRTQIGFVLKKNVSLRLTPTSESEVISTLTDGEPGRRLRTRGNYFFIRTANGAGWIEQKQFGLINPE
jgi:tetratricopeptide (TPR) repeat protein